MYGFSKSKQDNISYQEGDALKSLAQVYLAFSKEEIELAVKINEFVEVFNEEINS